MLRQLLPEGASGDSGLLRREIFVTSIWRSGKLEILHRRYSTRIYACGYAGIARQLLPEGVLENPLSLTVRKCFTIYHIKRHTLRE